MNAKTRMNSVAPIIAKPRLVKASDRAADREARLQHARELRAKRELSLNAILNRAVGCAPKHPRAMFESLFEVADRPTVSRTSA